MKKLKFIIPLLFIFLAFTFPIVNAADNDLGIMPISVDQPTDGENTNGTTEDEEQPSVNNTTQEMELKKGDVFLSDTDVTIDYVVDGNVFIFASNVTIDSQIGGDAFIFANNLKITENGCVFGNLFTISPNLDIQGVVYDLYTVSDVVTISGIIQRDARIATNTLNVNGTISGNAFVNSENIVFGENNSENSTIASEGLITGNLNYYSKSEISIPEEYVEGEINFTKIENYNMSSLLISLGSIVVLTIVVWLLCLWLAPKFLSNTSELITKKILPVIGLGIITPIGVTILSIILLFINITSSISVLMIALLCMLIAISTAIFTIAINNLICKKLKIEKTMGIFGVLILTSIVLWAIGLIPYVNIVINLVEVIVGLGIIISYIVFKKENNKVELNKEK